MYEFNIMGVCIFKITHYTNFNKIYLVNCPVEATKLKLNLMYACYRHMHFLSMQLQKKFYQRKLACLKIDRVFPIVIRHLSMQSIKWNKQASNAFLPILTEISAPLNFVLKSDTKMSF